MASKDSDQSLPKVGQAPLIIDVEFLEEEDETIAQPLDSIEEVSFPKSRSAMELPSSLPTPRGRARVVTVINIASQIALRGFRVLVIDSDSQGNCATGLGVDKSKVKNTTRDLILSPETAVDSRHATAVENLHIIVGDRSLIGLEQEMMRQLGREKRMKEALQPLLAHYDLVLIDTPPSLGLVTINALVASDGILVPVQTEYFALEGLALLSGTIREVRSLLNERLGVDGVLLTMHSQTLLNKQVAGEILENFPDLVVRPAVRRNVRLAEAPSHGIPIHLHDPSSPGGKDYQDIATELQHRWSL